MSLHSIQGETLAFDKSLKIFQWDAPETFQISKTVYDDRQ